MSSSSKRRQSERRKEQKSFVPSLLEIGPKGWLDEVLAVLMFCFALYLVLSLGSLLYNQAQLVEPRFDSVEQIANSLSSNVMGPVGGFIAEFLLRSMGYCAAVPVIWLLWLAKYFWGYDTREVSLRVTSRLFVFIGVTALLFFSCAIVHILFGAGSGGRMGALVVHPLLKMFSPWGSLLFLIGSLILATAVVTERSVALIIRDILNVGKISIGLVFVVVPVLIARMFHILMTTVLFSIKKITSLVLKDSKNESNEKRAFQEDLPKPRRRKNEINTEETIKADEDIAEGKNEEAEETEKEEETETYSHVLVSRKKPSAAAIAGITDSLKNKVEKISENQEALSFANYVRPDVDLLTRSEEGIVSEDDDELIQTSRQIEAKLRDFNIHGRVTEVHPGPVITLYEFEPAAGVKVGRIASLQDDLAMSLRAISIRIIAPIPKRGTVGIEVPNKHRELVRLRDVLESEAFINAESILSVPVGKDTYGEPVVVDIASMPHLLMAGTTGTGKSVCINTILLSLLYKATPSELGLIMIDPKILELSIYEGIPHLRVPVVTNAKQAKAVLDWAVREMERRYRLMQKYGVRNIDGYNKVVKGEVDINDPKKSAKEDVLLQEAPQDSLGEELDETSTVDRSDDELEVVSDDLFKQKLEPLPKIVIVIDELADLMLAVGRDIEELITRLAQKARAAGIHLIVATQRPSVDVITGLIKANFPARLSFRVSSRIDSRTILDSMGAEKLLGRGDMLFMAPGSVHLRRVHGAFVSDGEVKKVVEHLKQSASPQYDERIMRLCEKALEEEREDSNSSSQDGEGSEEYDSLYDKAVELVVQKGQASTSMIQRVFRIGYNRAARIIETMERDGIIGPMDGVKPRDVLIQNNTEGA